jgi:hypothetical protein
VSHPLWWVGPENPKPGIEGAMMWKGAGWVAAVGGRVGERADDVEELDDRSGPAVGDE